MTGVRFGMEVTGLDQLARALDRLPEDLQAEAAGVVARAAQAHRTAVAPRFPERSVTGNLARGLQVEQTGPLTHRVFNRAPHAHLYEFGFVHAGNGRQVAGHDVYVPEAQQIRSRMVADLEGVIAQAAARSGAFEVR